MNDEYELLNWKENFKYPNLVKVYTIGDGSCFFHAIMNSFYKPYITCMNNDIPVNRKEFIRKLRTDLSKNLKNHYNNLSRGKLPEISKDLLSLTLENMEKTLDSNDFIDNRFNEYISNMINKDIYILDGKKQDVYITGKDDDILYKNRDSIVLLYNEDRHHFELVGVIEENYITTLFKYDDPLIYGIRRRVLTAQ